jgi:hypothetical protein
MFVGLGCGDDSVQLTEDGTGSSAGDTSSTGDNPPTTTVPTSTTTTTEGGMTDGTASATDITTTAPTTSGTTTEGVDTTTTDTTSTTDTTATDTDTDTETDTGVEVTGRTVSQTVNAGHLVTSPNFRMVFTMGQPTQNQGTTTSPNFKLRGGLVGANGSPP